ncbi:MAG: trypsin-like peptidase domain-containing protein, partial [Anaerolineae bacterium]|nr:trypsin-like peptidase domain-containing protein [Anaerolineae bacterium]
MRLIILLGLSAQMLIACNFTDLQSNPADDSAIDLDAAPASEPAPTALPDEIVSAADAEYRLLSNIYERASPSVVNIEAVRLADDGSASDTRRGSGFVYDQQGHIITNAHLVNAVDAITVTLQSAQVYPAQVLALDSFSDLAVLKTSIEPERLAPLRIGESSRVKVGQRGIVIGNPYALSSSMTTGVISGLGRTLPSVELGDGGVAPGFDNPSIIQIDAIINPGNSGGPLLDSQGLVIGITTAIRSDNGLFQGIGFAVPADTMRRVIPDLIKHGRVDYSWMGISVMREDGGYSVAGLS